MPDNNMERVSSRIEKAIKSFCKSRVQTNNLFFMEQLRRYVAVYLDATVAPASPDRVLRNMRKRGIVKYEVVCRPKSLYKVIAVS